MKWKIKQNKTAVAFTEVTRRREIAILFYIIIKYKFYNNE